MVFLKRVSRALDKSFLNVGRTRARHDLLGRGDRFLIDNGFSRTLLESGNAAWPWRVRDGEASMLSGPSLQRRDVRMTESAAHLPVVGSIDALSLDGASTGCVRPDRAIDGAGVAKMPVGLHDTRDPSEERIAA